MVPQPESTLGGARGPAAWLRRLNLKCFFLSLFAWGANAKPHFAKERFPLYPQSQSQHQNARSIHRASPLSTHTAGMSAVLCSNLATATFKQFCAMRKVLNLRGPTLLAPEESAMSQRAHVSLIGTIPTEAGETTSFGAAWPLCTCLEH